LVNRGFGVSIPGHSVIRSHHQYDQRSGIFFLFLGERAESKGRSEDGCFSYSLLRCCASRMCFGDGCVISSSAICRLFGSWASAKIADWSACEQNPCRIADHPVDDVPRHCCSSPPAVSLARIVPLGALSNIDAEAETIVRSIVPYCRSHYALCLRYARPAGIKY